MIHLLSPIPPAKILITAPMKRGDPTEYTYKWALDGINIAKYLDYNVKVIDKDHTTHKKVSEEIELFKPELLIHYGHGCKYSLQGNKECIVSKKQTIDELARLASLTKNRNKCIDKCIDGDPCFLSCLFDSNIHLLKGKTVIAIACNSAAGLGEDAVKYGITYVGWQDLLMFPADSLGTQNEYGRIYNIFIKEFLLGHSLREAELVLNDKEDKYIRANKHIKYASLPLLWNKLNRKILGNKDIMLYH